MAQASHRDIRNHSFVRSFWWKYFADFEQVSNQNALASGTTDWFDSMADDDESLPVVNAALFAALEAQLDAVPEPGTKRKCTSCERSLSEAEHFIPGLKTCKDRLKKHRNRTRLKRRNERKDEILPGNNNSDKKKQNNWLRRRRAVVVCNKYPLFSCWKYHWCLFPKQALQGRLLILWRGALAPPSCLRWWVSHLFWLQDWSFSFSDSEVMSEQDSWSPPKDPVRVLHPVGAWMVLLGS